MSDDAVQRRRTQAHHSGEEEERRSIPAEEDEKQPQLRLAAAEDVTSTMQRLCQWGAFGSTTLQSACTNGLEGCGRLLTMARISVVQTNKKSATALQVACDRHTCWRSPGGPMPPGAPEPEPPGVVLLQSLYSEYDPVLQGDEAGCVPLQPEER